MTEEQDGCDDQAQTGPERRCVVTGQILPKSRLLRFVVSPDGEVVADVAGRLPGRGIWLCPSRDVVNTALGKKLFARAARRQVRVPDDLADRIEVMLVSRCLSTLGMARRSGQAVAGYEKVRAEILAGRARVLVEASDGAKDGSARTVRNWAESSAVMPPCMGRWLRGPWPRVCWNRPDCWPGSEKVQLGFEGHKR